MEKPKKLYRSREDRVIAGVAGGLGEYFAVDPIIIRILFVAFTLVGGSGIILYILAWIIIPDEPEIESKQGVIMDNNTEKDNKKSPKDHAETFESKMHDMAHDVKEAVDRHGDKRPTHIGAWILIILGVLFLLQNLTGFDVWSNFWPLILVAVGVSILVRSLNKDK